jgi:MoxR-like ATPase
MGWLANRIIVLADSLCVEVNQRIGLLDYPQNPQTQNAKEMLRV